MYDFLFAFSIMNAIRFGHNDRNQNEAKSRSQGFRSNGSSHCMCNITVFVISIDLYLWFECFHTPQVNNIELSLELFGCKQQ